LDNLSSGRQYFAKTNTASRIYFLSQPPKILGYFFEKKKEKKATEDIPL
jgi:hypothetical protein